LDFVCHMDGYIHSDDGGDEMIKTTRQIVLGDEFDNKQWLSVTDVKEVIEELKERFGVRPRACEGEEQDRFISYLDLKQKLGID